MGQCTSQPVRVQDTETEDVKLGSTQPGPPTGWVHFAQQSPFGHTPLAASRKGHPQADMPANVYAHSPAGTPLAASVATSSQHSSPGGYSQHSNAGDRAASFSGKPADHRLDHLTSLAASIFKVPIVIVIVCSGGHVSIRNMSGASQKEVPWVEWLLGWRDLIQRQERLAVPDMQQDDRFKDHLLVAKPPGVRFYAASPLTDPYQGFHGNMCLVDFEPHAFEPENLDMLDSMADMVVRETKSEAILAESRRASSHLARANSSLMQAIETFHTALLLVDVSLPGWPVLLANDAFVEATAISWSNQQPRGFWEMFATTSGAPSAEAEASLQDCASQMAPFVATVLPAGRMPTAAFTCSFSTVSNQTCHDFLLLMGAPDMAVTDHHCQHCYFVTVQPASASATPPPIAEEAASRSGSAALDVVWPDVEVGQLVGQGSFGRVYQGWWQGRLVAIKVIESIPAAKLDLAGNPIEATLTTGFDHPNLVHTYKYMVVNKPAPAGGEALAAPGTIPRLEEETWLLLEFCDKGCIQDAIDQRWFQAGGGVQLANVVITALEIASAMAYMHACNITHGDLTGSNVLLASSDGDARGFTAKIADFGLARQLIQSGVETRTHGTVTHMPPELLNDGLLTKASDVYAYGVLLFELYSGQRAWARMRHAQVIHAVAIQHKHPEFPPDSPPKYADLALRCMSAEPKQRPTFETVIAELREMLAGL
ncbi:hypothetical protein WJX72_000200 [[Myrmecia] bisecta]|uniref:Protein kinase domain-containing protein n=1 Tax=[Myrmecia] bisecta TaxID=41462 RepID=A0AAW1Q2D1_9CHLO